MHNTRLAIVCTVFLCLMLCLPGFAIGQGTSNVVAKLALQKGQHGSASSSSCIKQDATLGEGKQDATYIIAWSTLNEGGKTEEATSASYRLKDAIGQPVIGKCESASFKAYIGFWAPMSLWVVGVEEKQETRSKPYGPYGKQETRLLQNYPNPFTEKTSIQYAVASRQRKDKNLTTDYCLLTTLKVYDLSGKLVRTLVNEPQKPDHYQVAWDGRDNSGKRVPPGVYFYRLQAGSYTATKKLILLR